MALAEALGPLKLHPEFHVKFLSDPLLVAHLFPPLSVEDITYAGMHVRVGIFIPECTAQLRTALRVRILVNVVRDEI